MSDMINTRLNFEMSAISDQILAVGNYTGDTYIIHTLRKGKLLEGEFGTLKRSIVEELKLRYKEVAKVDIKEPTSLCLKIKFDIN